MKKKGFFGRYLLIFLIVIVVVLIVAYFNNIGHMRENAEDLSGALYTQGGGDGTEYGYDTENNYYCNDNDLYNHIKYFEEGEWHENDYLVEDCGVSDEDITETCGPDSWLVNGLSVDGRNRVVLSPDIPNKLRYYTGGTFRGCEEILNDNDEIINAKCYEIDTDTDEKYIIEYCDTCRECKNIGGGKTECLLVSEGEKIDFECSKGVDDRYVSPGKANCFKCTKEEDENNPSHCVIDVCQDCPPCYTLSNGECVPVEANSENLGKCDLEGNYPVYKENDRTGWDHETVIEPGDGYMCDENQVCKKVCNIGNINNDGCGDCEECDYSINLCVDKLDSSSGLCPTRVFA
ncbi:hypothetical protein GOV12_01605 [Candidatus Pacearchaeota archaeon]|nr:hypothetical protein [Candidatus Pacearchaeota archaeon]